MPVSAMASMRAAARAFTPELTTLVEDPRFSRVWANTTLPPRDLGLITVAALVVRHGFDELPAHLRRAIEKVDIPAWLYALPTKEYAAARPITSHAERPLKGAGTIPDRPRPPISKPCELRRYRLPPPHDWAAPRHGAMPRE